MQIKVNNFGPIEKASLYFSPLTVIVGKNNLGKSYLAQLSHVFLTFAAHNQRLGTRSNRIRQRMERDTKLYNEVLKEKSVNKKRIIVEKGLDECVNNITRDGEKELKSILESTFGLDVKQLINIHSNICKVECKYAQLTRLEMTIDEKSNVKLTIKYNKNKIIDSILDELSKIKNTDDFDILRFTSIRRYGYRIGFIENIFVKKLFGRYTRRSESIYIPAGRAGLLEGMDIVSQALMQLTTVAPIRGVSIPPLSGTTSQFYSLWIALRGRLGVYSPITDKFEEIFGGEIRFVKSEDGTLRNILYVIKNEGKEMLFNIIHAASAVKELMPIYLLIREIGNKNSNFIIEEPESHLHPGNQIKLMLILMELVNNGLNLIITTHSDFILRKISNNLGAIYTTKETGNRLTASTTRLYLLREDKNGSILEKIPISKYGLIESLPTFDDVINELYDEEIEIQEKI